MGYITAPLRGLVIKGMMRKLGAEQWADDLISFTIRSITRGLKSGLGAAVWHQPFDFNEDRPPLTV